MVHSNAAQLIELFQDQAVQQFLISFGDFVVGVLGKALEVVDLSPKALSLSTRRCALPRSKSCVPSTHFASYATRDERRKF